MWFVDNSSREVLIIHPNELALMVKRLVKEVGSLELHSLGGELHVQLICVIGADNLVSYSFSITL